MYVIVRVIVIIIVIVIVVVIVILIVGVKEALNIKKLILFGHCPKGGGSAPNQMVWGFLLSLLLEVKTVEKDVLGHISLVLNDGWWLLKKVPQVA